MTHRPKTLQDVIRFLKDCRETHVEWAEEDEVGDTKRRRREGTPGFHRATIADYDWAIEVCEEVKRIVG